MVFVGWFGWGNLVVTGSICYGWEGVAGLVIYVVCLQSIGYGIELQIFGGCVGCLPVGFADGGGLI